MSISPSEEAERLRSAQVALALDDLGGARLIFEYLATRGSATGAYQLAQTYDPQILVRTPIGAMFKPDAKVAEGWYLRAAELGHVEARKKLSLKK
jgi:TPR repeat protein